MNDRTSSLAPITAPTRGVLAHLLPENVVVLHVLLLLLLLLFVLALAPLPGSALAGGVIVVR